MTEAEWLICDHPRPMLEFLRGKMCDRKLRLFICAFFRQLYAPSDPRSAIIAIGEKYADGTAGIEELQTARALASRQDEPSRTIHVVLRDEISRMGDPFLRLSKYAKVFSQTVREPTGKAGRIPDRCEKTSADLLRPPPELVGPANRTCGSPPT
jgi:hypothetical protein